jgi:hypothetical protein
MAIKRVRKETETAAATVTKQVLFILLNETPGALRYQEVNAEGRALKSDVDGAIMASVYIRKQAMGSGVVPKTLTVSITYTA